MAKASRPGNQAVAGITGTSTTTPTTSKSNTQSAAKSSSQSGAGSSSDKSSSGYKSSGSTSVKNSYSGSTKSSAGNAPSSVLPGEAEVPYSDTFYAALAAGIPSGINASEFIAKDKAADASRGMVNGAKAYIGSGSVAPIETVDIAQQKAEIAARENQEKGRAVLAADYAVAQGVKALDRNLQDSRSKFQTQRNQVNADEAKALDNQVLYAEARGDRGGIGMSQYVRAQGEFEKADKVLAIGNRYLTELQNLEKWAKEKNVGVQEFNAKLRQWENEYLLKVGEYLTDAEVQAAKLFGVAANGAETADYRSKVNDRYAAGAKAMMSAGIVPSAAQLEAIGWTPQQSWIYRMANGG